MRFLDQLDRRTRNFESENSISDKDFSEISEKIEKSVCRKIKDTETRRGEILKMIENLSSKIDLFSGKTPVAVNLEANETDPEGLGSTSRQTRTNKLPRDEGQHICHCY